MPCPEFELDTSRDLGGAGDELFEVNAPIFTWRNCIQQRKASFKIAGALSELYTGHLQKIQGFGRRWRRLI
jgi:hypothetical protein